MSDRLPSCRWSRARLALYAGNDFSGPERTRIERHLKRCPACRAHLAGHQAALAALETAGAATPPATLARPSLWPALEQRLRETRRPESLRHREREIRWRTVRLALAGLAAAALIAGTIWVAPTARQYRVSVTVDRLPRVRIHRVSHLRDGATPPNVRSARRASLIRELPAPSRSASQAKSRP